MMTGGGLGGGAGTGTGLGTGLGDGLGFGLGGGGAMVLIQKLKMKGRVNDISFFF